jgi:hypothetical protein
MNVRAIYVPSVIAFVASIAFAVLTIWSASSILLAERPPGPPTPEVLQAMLIQGAFTCSFVLATITFGLIGSLGMSVAGALKVFEKRLPHA